MSESKTPTPADIAPKDAKEPAQDPKGGQSDADQIDWKAKYEETIAESRKWEQRAKENKAAAEAASKTEAEKAADRLAEIERRAAEAEARVLRRDIALEHKLTKDDAVLLDTITDENAMKALAQRLAADSAGKHGNYAPREGNNPRPSKTESSWGPMLQEL